ncbi:MAG: T9SS type A sorting domain-containing protein [Flavobacteriales bacterium]|nr:T9SS type A sorting domain-containing protein [Flavobacteriales bacterium]
MDSSFTLSAEDVLTTVTQVFVNDSILDPSIFTTYDGCTFTTGIPSMVRHAPSKPRVRPNPNTGRFTVEFQDPLMAESYYSVYDAMGKLLYQRPLPSGKETEEIDLSRFGKGTYVIKFTHPEGTSFERVVVE